jgi:hypothetical protein
MSNENKESKRKKYEKLEAQREENHSYNRLKSSLHSSIIRNSERQTSDDILRGAIYIIYNEVCNGINQAYWHATIHILLLCIIVMELFIHLYLK